MTGRPTDANADDDRHRTGHSSTTTQATVDTVFDVLAHRDRRAVIGYFMATGDASASTEELAEYIRQEDLSELDREASRYLLSLHHFHLPKLAEAGVVDYDWRDNVVCYHGWDLLEEVMNVISNN